MIFLTHKFSNFISSQKISFKIASFGKNVTSAYVFQWLIIGNLATILCKSLEGYQTIFAFITIFFFTFLTT
jgi:hypothetical protein